MEGLFQILSQYAPQILLGTAIVAIVGAAAAVRSLVWQRQHRRQWANLLDGARGESLEAVLQNALRENMALQDRLGEAEGRIKDLEKRMEKAKRHLGVVRFDAFEEVGGNQSFALALYDDNGDGAVINSLVGRNDCRVYAKPLQGGRSDRNLSQEERRAIEEAITRAQRVAAAERV
jgi:hypothetical protein